MASARITCIMHEYYTCEHAGFKCPIDRLSYASLKKINEWEEEKTNKVFHNRHNK